MNTKERKLFWETLESLEGKDVKSETTKLLKIIKYPKYLYRFRSSTINSLEGLRTNRLYFSSADWYDDPFDSFIHIDWSTLTDEIKREFQNTECRHNGFETISSIFGIPYENISKTIDPYSPNKYTTILKSLIEQTRKIIQKYEWSICFTEEQLNEVLWLKYAKNHTGFVMEYDLYDDSAFLCGTQEKCHLYPAQNVKYPVYPIYYSSEKYNATKYAQYVAIMELSKSFTPNIASEIQRRLPNMTWQRERIALIKHQCHEYDKEWRMLGVPEGTDRPFIVWRPSSVILGLKINQSDKNIICSLAKEAEIKKIYQCVINQSDDLDIKLIYEHD